MNSGFDDLLRGIWEVRPGKNNKKGLIIDIINPTYSLDAFSSRR